MSKLSLGSLYILFFIWSIALLACFPAFAASQLPLAPTTTGVNKPAPPRHGSSSSQSAEQPSSLGGVLQTLTQPPSASGAAQQEVLQQFLGIEGDPLAPLLSGEQPAVAPPASGIPAQNATPTQVTEGPNRSENNTITAVVQPFNSAYVTTPFSGTVRKVLVRDGEKVTKGQELVYFEQKQLEQELELAKSVLGKLSAEFAEKPPSSFLEQQLMAEKMQLAADEITRIESVIASASVVAPFAGRVTEVLAKPHQAYTQGAPLLELAEDGLLVIECTAPSKFYRGLFPDTQIQVYIIETGQIYNAVVRRMGGKVNPESKTIKIYASFLHEPTGLLPGMSGYARVVRSAKR